MATIAKVLTQDGRTAAGPATDGAGGDARVEFLALLSEATGAMPAPAVPATPALDPAPVGDETAASDEAGEVMAGSLISLVAAGEPRRMEATAAGVVPTGPAAINQRPAAPPAAPVVLPGRLASLDLHAAIAAADGRNAPAATLPASASPVAAAVLAALPAKAVPVAATVPAALPANASPVAATVPAAPPASASPVAAAVLAALPANASPVATTVPAVLPANASPVAATVLAALQAGQRPVPHSGGVSAPAGPPMVDPAPVVDAIARLAEAVSETAAADTGAQAEPDDGSTLPSPSGQAVPGGPIMREALVSAAQPRSLPGTVGTPAWKHALGTEVRLMIERGIGTATLRLSPEHLGPVEVRIDLADDSAKVWFTATHADTRAALTDALPRLREMLASVGINLGDASVHREMPGEPGRRDDSSPGGPAAVPEAEAESRVVVTRLDAGRGLVDEYA